MKIKIDEYFLDPVTKVDRRTQYPNEYEDSYLTNAIILLDKINSLLDELGITETTISSGWRPLSVNNKITNASKKSAHMIGKAIDLKDNSDQHLAKLIASQPELLRKYGLFLENPDSTKYWIHLDYLVRADRPSRIFNP